MLSSSKCVGSPYTLPLIQEPEEEAEARVGSPRERELEGELAGAAATHAVALEETKAAHTAELARLQASPGRHCHFDRK